MCRGFVPEPKEVDLEMRLKGRIDRCVRLSWSCASELGECAVAGDKRRRRVEIPPLVAFLLARSCFTSPGPVEYETPTSRVRPFCCSKLNSEDEEFPRDRVTRRSQARRSNGATSANTESSADRRRQSPLFQEWAGVISTLASNIPSSSCTAYQHRKLKFRKYNRFL